MWEIDRQKLLESLAADFARLIAFADAEDNPVLAAKLEDSFEIFKTCFMPRNG